MPKLTVDALAELEITEKLIRYNEAYRKGSPVVTDAVYDKLRSSLEALNPKHPFLKKVGAKVSIKDRVVTNPFYMGSLTNKVNWEDFYKWMQESSKKAKCNRFIAMPKYDGVSICMHEPTKLSNTRGDGYVGSDVTAHMKILDRKKTDAKLTTFGEAVFLNKDFKQFEEVYSSPRSLMVGKLRNDLPEEEILKHGTYIRYSIAGSKLTKKEQLDVLNQQCNSVEVPYFEFYLDDAPGEIEKKLKKLYATVSKEVEIDGVVVALDVSEIVSEGNPKYSVAYKSGFDEVKDVAVESIDVQVTKQGLIKPVMVIQPTRIDGAMITNVYLDNFKTVKELQCGTGAIVRVKRSGKVIPRLVDVVLSSKPKIPRVCPSCSSYLLWTETGTDLYCPNKKCPDKVVREIEAFFSIVGVESVGYGVCSKLYERGYDSLKSVIRLIISDNTTLAGMESFGVTSARKIRESLIDSLDAVTMGQLMHASGIFYGLGSTRLEAISKVFPYGTWDEVTLQELVAMEGISDTLAQIFASNIHRFASFYEWLKSYSDLMGTTGVSVKTKSDALSGSSFVFTNFRDKGLEMVIIEHGGEIKDSLSKKVSFVVTNDKNAGTSKLQKAEKYGILIITPNELREVLKEKGVL